MIMSGEHLKSIFDFRKEYIDKIIISTKYICISMIYDESKINTKGYGITFGDALVDVSELNLDSITNKSLFFTCKDLSMEIILNDKNIMDDILMVLECGF